MNKKLFTSTFRIPVLKCKDKIKCYTPFNSWDNFNVSTNNFDTFGSINKWNNFNVNTNSFKSWFGHRRFHTSQKALELSGDVNVDPNISWKKPVSFQTHASDQKIIEELRSENKRLLMEIKNTLKKGGENTLKKEIPVDENISSMINVFIGVTACSLLVVCCWMVIYIFISIIFQ